jgi:hypothetical protein
MNFLDFMSQHPGLTIGLAIIIGLTLDSVSENIASAFRSKKKDKEEQKP